jgi:uroporphyrinogen decarboxylase
MTNSTMTSRERVAAALDHQQPDRVPTAVGGGPYGIVDPLYLKLLDLYGLGDPPAPFRQGHSISYMDDRLLEALGTDIRYVYPGLSPSSPSRQISADKAVDGFGQTWVRAVPYYYSDTGILQETVNLDEIDRLVRWPNPSDPVWMAGTAERAKMLRENTKYWICARAPLSHGPFQMACDLRGTERLMFDFVDNEAFAVHLIERVTETIDGLLRAYLGACGRWIDMIELPGDDFAGNQNLIISPRMFRKFIQPSLVRFVKTIREYRSDLRIMFHSDGNIYRLIPDLIASGVDTLHPLEPLESMNLDAIKTEFGSQLSFIGGIDISHALSGTPEELKAEVEHRIQQLGANGGYILAPSNHIQADVPPENVRLLFEHARRVGIYSV